MASPIVITGRKRDAIWLEFERSEDGKRAKCKNCLWEKAVVVERMKDHWHFASDFSSDFQFRVLDMFYIFVFMNSK